MSQQILSELVANVAAVHVTIGQQVEAGTEVALLESMKMEIPVLAEAPGTVEAVHISPGDLVQEGDSLIVLND
ncbi:biotin/lipoyl-binding carrier protein [Kytococcus sedentarius]|uniref:biotin/lipoyl-binding carrier protein n=1 Tax=Kytococcus sedentarius TaxID=1276 RepID=UPI0038790AF6